jgi:tetratricopeptide (TPR) repeat protein
LAELSDRRHALPPKPAFCFGRDEVIEKLVHVFITEKSRSVALLGMRGIGKSTVALSAIHDQRVIARFGECRYFVRCDTAESYEALVGVICREFGITSHNPELALQNSCSAAPTLLVLDNFETPFEKGKEIERIEELLLILSRIPTLQFAITLRGTEFPGAQVWWVEFPEIKKLDPPADRQVFVALAPGHKDDPLLETLLLDLEGHPLTITLMAKVAVAYDSLQPVVSRWRQEGAIMATRGSQYEGRNANLIASVRISIDSPRMSNHAREILAVIARMPDGLSTTVLRKLSPPNLEDSLYQLKQNALVYEANQRIRLLAPIREAAQIILSPASQLIISVQGHFLDLAHRAQKVGTKRGLAAVQLIQDLANIENSIRAHLSRENPKHAIASALALTPLVRYTGYGSSALLVEALSTETVQSEDRLRAHCLRDIGVIAMSRYDLETAAVNIFKALEIYMKRDIADLASEAFCRQLLGQICTSRGKLAEGDVYYIAAAEIYATQLSDLIGKANCVRGLGESELKRNNLPRARMHLTWANCQFEDHKDDLIGKAHCLWRLADVDTLEKQFDSAFTLYGDAMKIYRAMHSQFGMALCTRRLGQWALAQDRFDDAREYFNDALKRYAHVGELYSIGRIHYFFAKMAPNDVERRKCLDQAINHFTDGKCHDQVASIQQEFNHLFALPDPRSPVQVSVSKSVHEKSTMIAGRQESESLVSE